MKNGLDDFFAGGGTVDELYSLASETLRPLPDEQETYYAEKGSTYYYKETKDGPVPVLLANFTAGIVEDVVEDDGAETRRLFEIEAQLCATTRRITVPSETFGAMNWTTEQLGPSAIVTAGMGSKDRLREAIQVLSKKPIPQRVIHRHLGWIRHGENWIFLHAAGAIGATGTVEGVDVRVDAPLDRYILPSPPAGDRRREAVRASLALLAGLATDDVIIPLFSFLWTTVNRPMAESLHVTGKTGVRKTELLALAQRHFGAGMDAQHLPGSWSSTAYSNEVLGFLAADCLLGIDDFSPNGSCTDVQRQNRDADRVFRGRGNGSGRGRLRPDGSLRPLKPFRAGVASTGEDVPHGHSIRARLLVLAVEEGEVDLARLTECQRAGDSYASAMAAVVQWMASRRDGLLARRGDEVHRVRDELLARAPHGRTAMACAELLFGFRIFLEAALDFGAIDQAEMTELQARAKTAILSVLTSQLEEQTDSDPAKLFIENLGAALTAGECHLVDRQSLGVPRPDALAHACGWQRSEDDLGGGWRSRGLTIGYVDAGTDSVLLVPKAAYKAAQRQAADSPNRINIGEKSLWKRLSEAGVLVQEDGDRSTRKTRVGDRARNLLHVRLPFILGETGTSGTGPNVAAEDPVGRELFPIRVPDPDRAEPGTGTPNGNKDAVSALRAPEGEAVPDVPFPGELTPMFSEVVDDAPCRHCRGSRFWRRDCSGPRVCARCHPPQVDPSGIEWVDMDAGTAGVAP